MHITNNNLSFQASINTTNFTKSKHINNIDRIFTKLTADDLEGCLIIKKIINDKIEFTTYGNNATNIKVGLRDFRNDLNTLSDVELAEKFSKYYRIIKDAKNILNLELSIANLSDKLSHTKGIIQNLKERNIQNFAEQYEKLANINNKKLTILKNELSKETKSFYEEKEEISKLYPEIKQIELQ